MPCGASVRFLPSWLILLAESGRQWLRSPGPGFRGFWPSFWPMFGFNLDDSPGKKNEHNFFVSYEFLIFIFSFSRFQYSKSCRKPGPEPPQLQGIQMLVILVLVFCGRHCLNFFSRFRFFFKVFKYFLYFSSVTSLSLPLPLVMAAAELRNFRLGPGSSKPKEISTETAEGSGRQGPTQH